VKPSEPEAAVNRPAASKIDNHQYTLATVLRFCRQ
jgi:hypothetical protein